MKKIIIYFSCSSLLMWMLAGCGNDNKKETSQIPTTKSIEQIQKAKVVALANDLLGNYHGIQHSYHVKNQYGDDMIINGNKVTVPSIDFKFLLKENGAVSLQQTNLEDNSRVYSEGTMEILFDSLNVVKIKCELHDSPASNQTYTLAIDKSKKIANCTGTNEPDVKLEKQ